MEWQHSGSPSPKNSECKNPLEKFLPLFLGGGGDQDSIFLVDYLSKGQNNQCGVLLISVGTIEGHFEGKMLRNCHKGGIVLAR
jgi:hypothetical protein